MTEKISVKPVIQSSKIKSVEVGNVSLPLREEISLNELPQLVEAVEFFFKYVDVGKLGRDLTTQKTDLQEWSEQELRKFVQTQLREGQKKALSVLAETDEIEREEYVERMKEITGDKAFRGWSLGGLLAGITMKSKSEKHENPVETEYRTVGDELMCYYRLKRKEYKGIISKALKEEK